MQIPPTQYCRSSEQKRLQGFVRLFIHYHASEMGFPILTNERQELLLATIIYQRGTMFV